MEFVLKLKFDVFYNSDGLFFIIIIIIIIIINLSANGLSPGGSGYYACKKSVPLQARGAQRFPGSLGSQITCQWPRVAVRLSALRVDPRAIVRSEGLCQWKIPMAPSGIEPATFRFVAQRLNHCATAVPIMHIHK